MSTENDAVLPAESLVLTVSPYYVEPYSEPGTPRKAEVIGGYGIWNVTLEDWQIPDGYASEEDANRGVERIGAKGVDSEYAFVAANWGAAPRKES